MNETKYNNNRNFTKIAEFRGGKCLSNEYFGGRINLEWECGKGHKWSATPHNIKNSNSWCPECSGKRPLSIEEMYLLAEKHGGRCISFIYINSHSKLEWECSEGHTWKAAPNMIKQGTWCPKCKPTYPLTIEEMQNIAIAKGGKCLSGKYINSITKLKWQCDLDHEWLAIARGIKHNNEWCPTCADTTLSIHDMQNIANERGGKCLSVKYINNKTNLKWQCSKEHTWEAAPSDIKKGRWCTKCIWPNSKLTINDMHEMAKLNDGQCLSTEFINVNKKNKMEM